MAKKTTDITTQLRQAMKASGLSMYALAKRSGVSTSMVYQFMVDGKDVRFETAAKLAALLELELCPIDRRATAAKRKGR